MFATGCVLTAIGEVLVETRPEDYAYPLTLGAFVAVVGCVLHYGAARLLEARRTAQLRPALLPAPDVQLVGRVSAEGA